MLPTGKIHNKFILSHIPTDVKTYVEPFGVMFDIYFSLNQSPKKVIYNDENYLNYNLFYWLSRKHKTFHKKIKDLSASEYLFYEYKSDIFKIVDKKPKIDSAIKYAYVLNNCSSVYNVRNSKFKINNVFFDKFKETIYSDTFIKKVKKIKTLSLNYKNVIKKFNSGNTFFFIDPPSNIDHKELSKTIKNIKGKFILRSFEFPELKEYYPEEKFIWIHNNKELIIKNY